MDTPKAERFTLGQFVWRKINREDRGMIREIRLTPNGYVYVCRFAGESEDAHCYSIELTHEQSFETK